MKELVDKILQMSHSFRFVGIVDNVENTLFSKMGKGKVSLVTEKEEEKFAKDLQTIQKIHDEFSEKLGRVTFSHIIRENVQQLIFHISRITLYVTCEPDVDHNTIVKISKLIMDTVKEVEPHKIPNL